MQRASSVPGPVAVAEAPRLHAVPAPVRSRGRLTDLDRAKGIAILLVVFGHLVPQEDPAGVTWYEPLRIAIYLFHMPLFMYLSGYVAFWSGAAKLPLGGWPTLVLRRAKRLLVPFFGFGCAILAAKLVAAHVMHVDNVPTSLAGGLDSLLLHTARSPAMSVWYIGVLFIYVIATPLLLRLPRLHQVPAELQLMLVAIVLYLIQAPPVFYMDRVCRFFVFFVAGGVAARAGARWWAILDQWYLPALLALVAVVSFAASGGGGVVHFNWKTDAADHFPYKTYMLASGLLAMVAFHGLARSQMVARREWLVFLGTMSFAIYLLNTICLGLTKGILLKFLSWNARDFPLIASVMMVAGVIGPIVIKRYLLRHVPALDRITD